MIPSSGKRWRAALAALVLSSAVTFHVHAQPSAQTSVLLDATRSPEERVAAYDTLLREGTGLTPTLHTAAVDAYLGRAPILGVDAVAVAKAAAARGAVALDTAPPRARADYALKLATAANVSIRLDASTTYARELWAAELYADAASQYRAAGDVARAAQALLEQGLVLSAGAPSFVMGPAAPAPFVRRGQALIRDAIALSPADTTLAVRGEWALSQMNMGLMTESVGEAFATAADHCARTLQLVLAGATTADANPAEWAKRADRCAGRFIIDHRPVRESDPAGKARLLTQLLSSSALPLTADARARMTSVRGMLHGRAGATTEAAADLASALGAPQALDRTEGVGPGVSATFGSARMTELALAILRLRERRTAEGLARFDRAVSPTASANAWAPLPREIDAVVVMATSSLGLSVFVLDRNGHIIGAAEHPDQQVTGLLVDATMPRFPWNPENPFARFRFGFLTQYYYTRDTLRGASLGELAASVTVLRERTGAVVGPTLSRALASAGLRGGARIVLVPSGMLASLPLAAMTNPATHHPFAQDYTLSFAPSLHALFKAANGFPAAAPPSMMVGLGPPGDTAPLPFARAEFDMIRGLFQQATPVSQTDAFTPEGAVSALSAVPYWHIATHGDFSIDAVAGADTTRTGLALDGGRVMSIATIERFRAPRPVRLAVLSACESASTLFAADPIGVASLPSALMNAGAQSVVGAGWAVDDVSTSLLMIRFYDAHLREGLKPAEALKTAQTWLAGSTTRQISAYIEDYARRTRLSDPAAALLRKALAAQPPDSRPFSDPFDWAGFTAHGL